MVKNKNQKSKTILAVSLSTATFLLMSVLSVLSISEWSFLEEIKLDIDETQQREATFQKVQWWVKTALTKLSNRTEKWLNSMTKDNKVYANEIKEEPSEINISNNFLKNLFVWKKQTIKNVNFIDINKSEEKDYINTLGQLNLINTNNKNFNPNNHARLFEATKLLMNSYYQKVGYPESAWVWNEIIQGKQLPLFYKKAYEKGLLNNISNYTEFWRSLSYSEFNIILKNFNTQYPNIISIEKYTLSENQGYITRWELAKVIIETLNINIIPLNVVNNNIQENNTTDIVNTINETIDNTKTLVEKWVISKEIINNTNQIITRSDFIEILSNAILNNEWKTLTNQNITFDNSIVDINYNDENILKILYAKQNGLLDYLLEVKRWEEYFYPEIPITKHEAYYIIGTYTNNLDLIKTGASDQENINLSELSNIINNNLEKKIIGADSKLWQIMEDINAIIEVKNIISNI